MTEELMPSTGAANDARDGGSGRDQKQVAELEVAEIHPVEKAHLPCGTIPGEFHPSQCYSAPSRLSRKGQNTINRQCELT
jgi:hypothetical protein